jgi:hypothetical protein
MPNKYLKRLLKLYFIKEIGNIIEEYVGKIIPFSFNLNAINELFFANYHMLLEEKQGITYENSSVFTKFFYYKTEKLNGPFPIQLIMGEDTFIKFKS